MPVVAFSVINIVLTLSFSYGLIDHWPACLFWLARLHIFHNDLRHRHRPLDDCQYYCTTPAESYALMTPQMLLTLGSAACLLR